MSALWEKFRERGSRKRLMLLIFSPFFLMLVGYYGVNQASLMKGIVNQYFKISFTNVLHLLATDNWVDVLIQNAQSMSRHIAIFISAQLLLIILALTVIFYLLFKIRKESRWFLGDKLVFAGYLLIVLSLLGLGGFVIYSTLEMYSTIQTDLNRLSVAEIKTLSKDITAIFINSDFSLNHLFKELVHIYDSIRSILFSIEKIANIPNLIQNWWQGLLALKIYAFGLGGLSIFSIIAGHIIEIWRLFDLSQWFKRSKQGNKKVKADERILLILEQQTKILAKLEEQHSQQKVPVAEPQSETVTDVSST